MRNLLKEINMSELALIFILPANPEQAIKRCEQVYLFGVQKTMKLYKNYMWPI